MSTPTFTSKTALKKPRTPGVQKPRPHITSSTQVDGSKIFYIRARGIDDFVGRVRTATPWDLVEAERQGVSGVILKDLSKRMNIPASRFFAMMGVPKATAEKKAAAGEMLKGSSGQAIIGMAKLIGIAQEIVSNSTSTEAQGFNVTQWLGQWLERDQPALGGRKPADVIDTPTGLEMVSKLLRAVESGSYQ